MIAVAIGLMLAIALTIVPAPRQASATTVASGGISVHPELCLNGTNRVLLAQTHLPIQVCFDPVAEKLTVRNIAPYWVRLSYPSAVVAQRGEHSWAKVAADDWTLAVALGQDDEIPPGGEFVYAVGRSQDLTLGVYPWVDAFALEQAGAGLEYLFGALEIPKVSDATTIVELSVAVVDYSRGVISVDELEKEFGKHGIGLVAEELAKRSHPALKVFYDFFYPLLEQLAVNADYLNAMATFSGSSFTIWSTQKVPHWHGEAPKCAGRFATIVGTNAGEVIEGTPGDDVIVGLGGNDIIRGHGGNDRICGGDGNDHITGGDGHDILGGTNGNDIIGGQAGNDRIWGDAGSDRIWGDAGNDTIYGGAGNDTLNGGAGHDHIEGGGHNDRIVAGYGNDTLRGDAGHDTLEGGPGNDDARGGTGNDRLYGAAGADRLHGDTGADRAWGGAGGDVLVGGSGNDHLDGGTGNDSIWAHSGDDYLYGGPGHDRLNGGAGTNDRCLIGEVLTGCENGIAALHNTIVELTGTGRSVNPSFLVWDGQLYHIGSNADYWDCHRQTGGKITKLTEDQVKAKGWELNWHTYIDRCR